MFPLVYPRVSPVPLLIPILSPFSAVSFLFPPGIRGLIPWLSPISPVSPAGPHWAVGWTAGSKAGSVGSGRQGAAYRAARAGPLHAIPAAKGKGSCNWLTHCGLPSSCTLETHGDCASACESETSGFSQTCTAQLQPQWTGEKAVSYPQSLTKSPQICQECINSFLKVSHRGLALKAYNMLIPLQWP